VALARPSAMFISAARQPEAVTPPIRCPHCRKLNTIQKQQGGYATATFRCVACHRISSITALSA